MPEIEVTGVGRTEEGWSFEVVVREGDSRSVHRVTLSRADLADLRPEGADPGALVRDCFGFLLAREPKESILSRFDVGDIERYFPDFRREVRGHG